MYANPPLFLSISGSTFPFPFFFPFLVFGERVHQKTWKMTTTIQHHASVPTEVEPNETAGGRQSLLCYLETKMRRKI